MAEADGAAHGTGAVCTDLPTDPRLVWPLIETGADQGVSSREGAHLNILIVEDNRHMRRMLVEMVRQAFNPSQVLDAGDGSDALRLVREYRPELILMDIGLPDAHGLELTARIREMLPESKVVIVSNIRNSASQDAARSAGAAAYVFKDEVYEKLLPELTRLMNSR